MGNHRSQLGIVEAASKKAKVSKEVQQPENEKQRGHELKTERAAIENINQLVKQWAVVRNLKSNRLNPNLKRLNPNPQIKYST